MHRHCVKILVPVFLVVCGAAAGAAEPWVTYAGQSGPGAGKHIVLVSGDEEYRSEEALPQLGKILAARHGFNCTVLFAIDPATGEIDPAKGDNIPGLEALKTADLLILFTRFRNLPDDQMQHFANYLKTGKPIIGMRTATHAFNIPAGSKFRSWSFDSDAPDFMQGFGRNILGETWINHHGHHGKESTRGIILPEANEHPIVRGIKPGEIWGDTDVYTVRLPMPESVQPLVFGQVLTGMQPNDPPLEGEKNDPMMPIAWLNHFEYQGVKGESFCSTLGAATDLTAVGSRRMYVNAVYYLLGLQDRLPAGGAAVDTVGEYKPTRFGFGAYKIGVKPADHALATAELARQATPLLKLEKGDHICIVGNTLAERMQHYGWLETLLHSQFPRHELVFRNLAYAGDEVNGWQDSNKRLRSMSFGSQDEWLAASAPCPQPAKQTVLQDVDENRFELIGTKADVIFAFFGYNESFAGEAGLPRFKQNLADFIKHTAEQKYNGKSAPRLVLFSPIAMELVGDPNLPGPDEVAAANARLKSYTEAMKDVAAENGTAFVDLFTPTSAAGLAPPADASRPITINGVHINEKGDRQVAAAAFAQLAPDSSLSGEVWARLQSLRATVNDKNWHWFHRYRTTDGYSTYGDRAFLSFVDQQTNYVVLQRELKILDVLTANRDKVVWSAAQGEQIKTDDSNTPPFVPVKTNKPGAGPDGTHIYLSGIEEMTHFTLGAGLQVQLFASETEFPELINPVQMAWDTKGRLWVAAWPTYPHYIPKQPMNDKLLILEDTDSDGKADVCKTFAGDLHNPTGFEFWNGGVIVAQGPEVKFLKDTDGDDKYDTIETLLSGIDTADTHHTVNSFTLDPGGALYMQEGTFHHTQVETAWGPPVRLANAGAFRYEPRSQKFEVFVSYGFANPHGHVFDRWGQDFMTDGTGAQTYLGAAFSGQVDFPDKHGGLRTVYNQRTRPCPATEIVSSRHFPDDWQGNLLVGNVIGFQGILRYQVEDQDSGFLATEKEPVLFSDDPNFRPSDLEMGPDGALYFTDWQNAIIGHMQHNLRDPSRDHQHGRVYRVTYEGRELLKPAAIAGEPVGRLLELLKSPEDRVRYRARIELSGRPSAEVVAAVGSWIEGLDKQDADYQHNVLEGLWVHQHHNAVNEKLLKQLLASPDFHARAAATRVLCYWRDRVSDPLELLRTLVNDENPRVRLEAVRALSFFDGEKAVEVATESLIHPQDDYLKYTLQETMNTLDRRLEAAKKRAN